MRAEAERTLRDAENYERGAEGERQTAAALNALGPDYYLLHDIEVPGQNANFDHLVIGPSGVWVIDAKARKGTGTVGDGTLWFGRYPMRREAKTLRWLAEQAELHLGAPARPLACIVGASLQTEPAAFDGIEAVTVSSVVSHISAAPKVLDREGIQAISARASVLGPIMRPTAQRSPTRGRSSSPQTRTDGAAGRPARSSPPKRPSRQRTSVDPSRRRSTLGRLVLAVVGVLVASTILREIGRASLTDTTRSPPVPSFTCPRPGAGWTATPQRPDLEPGVRELRVRWRTGDNPAWSASVRWGEGVDAPTFPAGLPPSTPMTMRVEPVLDDGSSAPTATTSMRAPTDTC